MGRNHTKILFKELSYILQGCVFEIRAVYGAGHKERVYQNLLADYLLAKGVKSEKEKAISVYSEKSGKTVGKYVPDLIIEEKIIVELKASNFSTDRDLLQLDYYLKNSLYELGYLINFGTPSLILRRRIYTNDRKHFRVLS